MSRKSDEPGLVRMRKDPYESEDSRWKPVSVLLRLLFLFGIALACGVASLLLYQRWRSASPGIQVEVQGSNPNLSATERLYLESYLATHATALSEPANALTAPVNFVISPGESANQIARNLVAAGLLDDSQLFINYLRFYGLDASLTAGAVEVQPGLTIPEIAQLLANPYQQITLNFLPGWRLEEMTGYLATISPAQIDPEEFLAIAQRRAPFDLEPYTFLATHPAGASLEGYLFPGRYEISTDTTAAALVDLMLARFEEQVTPSMRQAFGAHGLSVREAVTLASIVERETPIDSERGLIAGVFLNRLRDEMPLQADSTVQYALGFDAQTANWWKSPLAQADLQVNSSYNTYVIAGLPPGPIANPGLLSLQAVAAPEASGFLFFVLDCETQGGHLFSVTFDEHLANVQKCSAP